MWSRSQDYPSFCSHIILLAFLSPLNGGDKVEISDKARFICEMTSSTSQLLVYGRIRTLYGHHQKVEVAQHTQGCTFLNDRLGDLTAIDF